MRNEKMRNLTFFMVQWGSRGKTYVENLRGGQGSGAGGRGVWLKRGQVRIWEPEVEEGAGGRGVWLIRGQVRIWELEVGPERGETFRELRLGDGELGGEKGGDKLNY